MEEGVSAIALHGRTAIQHYGGTADWEAIARLKEACRDPGARQRRHLERRRRAADDGRDRVRRGRRGPGLPGAAVAVRGPGGHVRGRRRAAPPPLGEVAATMDRHATLMAECFESERHAVVDFRKHVGWYLKGFTVGAELRRRLATAESLAGLREGLAELDPAQPWPEGVGHAPRARPTRATASTCPPDGWTTPTTSPSPARTPRTTPRAADGAAGRSPGRSRRRTPRFPSAGLRPLLRTSASLRMFRTAAAAVPCGRCRRECDRVLTDGRQSIYVMCGQRSRLTRGDGGLTGTTSAGSASGTTTGAASADELIAEFDAERPARRLSGRVAGPSRWSPSGCRSTSCTGPSGPAPCSRTGCSSSRSCCRSSSSATSRGGGAPTGRGVVGLGAGPAVARGLPLPAGRLRRLHPARLRADDPRRGGRGGHRAAGAGGLPPHRRLDPARGLRRVLPLRLLRRLPALRLGASGTAATTSTGSSSRS